MKLIKIYSLISFLFLLSCGHKDDNRFIITHNGSRTDIYCFILKHELSSVSISEFNFSQKAVVPNNKSYDHVDKLTWEEFIKTCDNQKIRFFIVKKDSIDKYGWKEIFKKNIYNKKCLFTIEDLDKINWEINYIGE